MTVQERYEAARKMYADVGVDTDAAIAKLKEIPVSLHCWQGDDVTGFDHDGPLTGGIQTTGNYPGKARDTGTADAGHGRGDEPHAWQKEIKSSCKLCNL